ncbi:MAG: Lrp/AsnC ligand binding domain-containing protein [Muribaculaceae bacterium]|nr:Lrp/AsnC ligand binding domain-containing protein [Muribaculaceae bacterium]MDE5596041.1 Lrp/AsnC ligand binding domain-containing protein [Muribaculaceae bacterium]
MNRQNFDALDLKILRDLSLNARKPYLEIAREYGVSGAAVHQRIQKLLANGVIKGSQCLIEPTAMGYDTCAYVGIYLREPSRSAQVVEDLQKIPEIIECHYTTGRYDILVKLVAHNNEHLLHLLQNEIQQLGAARTETLMSFREVLKRPVPVR